MLILVEIAVVPRVCYTFGNNQKPGVTKGGTTMGKMPHLVSKRKKAKKMGEPKIIRKKDYEGSDIDTRVEMIRALIPIGLMAIYEELDREVVDLAGKPHQRKAGEKKIYRHGTNPGSVKLSGQRVAIKVPRVRGRGGEVRLSTYERFHRGGEFDEVLFRRILYGISCRNYEKAAREVPGAIGISSSSVSRQFIKVSAGKLKAFQERDVSHLDIIALFMDGKCFAEDEMVIALGVDLTGRKHILGFVQTGTENGKVLSQFLYSLLDRGLRIDQGLLVVIDGSKGLRASVNKVFKGYALIQRCQWHKRENVVSYLPKRDQSYWRKRLQKAYGRPTYQEAKQALLKIRAELSEVNESAVRSLDEGLEETLTLHRLGLFPLIGRSLKTTNIIESVNAQAEERCGKVDHWVNSNQKQRWLAAALMDIEPRLRRLLGYRHLPTLRIAIMKELNLNHEDERSQRAA